MTRQKLFLGPYGPTYCSKCADNVEFEQSRAVPDLSQLNQLLAINDALVHYHICNACTFTIISHGNPRAIRQRFDT
jgi:hypothetical protein